MEPGTARVTLDLDTPERVQRLRAALGVTSFGLNLMRLQPGQRGRVHRHREQEEVYLVLDGVLTVRTPEEDHQLRQWEALRVAPDVRRQLVNRGDAAVTFLAIGGAGEHVGRDGVAYDDMDAPEHAGRPPMDVPLPPDLPR